MLETLKKKWWLVAIVVVVGGVMLDNAGIINKSAEKILTSQDVWVATIRDPYTGEMDEEHVQYFKFNKKDAFQSGNLEDIQNMTDSVVNTKSTVKYADKNKMNLYPDKTSYESISIKFDEMDKDNLKGKFIVVSDGVETSTDMVLKPAK